MKRIHFTIFIISFISLVTIGLGGLHRVSGEEYTETNTLSNLLTTLNNDQVYRVGSKDHLYNELVATEITEVQESSVDKVIYNSFLNSEFLNKQITQYNSDFPSSQAPTKIDRYLLLQTFRL